MNRLRTAVFALVCALGLAAVAPAQTTTITASHLRILGFDIPTGTVTAVGVNSSGQPISFADATGALNGTVGGISALKPIGYQCAVTAGAIVGAIGNTGTTGGTCALPDSTLTTPVHILYTFVICDTSTGYRTSGMCYTLQSVPNITGTTFALDHYGPPAPTTNVATLQAAAGTTTPSSCILPSVFTNTTTHLFYSCIGGVFVPTNALPYISNVSGVTQATCVPGTSNLTQCYASGISATEFSGWFRVDTSGNSFNPDTPVATISLPTHGTLGDICQASLFDADSPTAVALYADAFTVPGTVTLWFAAETGGHIQGGDSGFLQYTCVRAVAP